MASKISRRLSLPLSDKDEVDLALIRKSPERLRDLKDGLTNASSESAIVHAVFEKGLRSIREQAMEETYAEMAADAKVAAEAVANRLRLARRPRDSDAD